MADWSVSTLSGMDLDSWQVLEDMKDKGELTASLGVSNFRPQDLETLLKACKYKPVVNRAYSSVEQVYTALRLAP